MQFVLFHLPVSAGLVYAVPAPALVSNLSALSAAASCGCACAQQDYVLSPAARCTQGQGTAAARPCLVRS